MTRSLSKNKTKNNLWDLLIIEDQEGKVGKLDKSKENEKTNSRLISRLGTILGLTLWAYALINVFIYNIDASLKNILPQEMHMLVDYKLILFIAVFGVIVFTLKKYYLLLLYIMLFPLIVVFWKIPKFLYGLRSWIIAIGAIDFMVNLFSNFKTKTIVICSALLSIIFITTENQFLLLLSILLASFVIIYLLYNTIKKSFFPRGFIDQQTNMVKRLTESKFIKEMTLLDDKTKSATKKLTLDQSKQVVQNAQQAAIFLNALYYWAYQLEKYAESNASKVMNWLAYAFLVIRVVFFLAIINYALYKISPNSFSVIGDGGFIIFVYYSITSLSFSEVSVIQATQDISILIRLCSGIIGIGILGSFILSVALSRKNAQQELELSRAVSSIKKTGSDFEQTIVNEYSVGSIEELMKKLQVVGAGLFGFIVKISNQIPEEYKK